MYSSILYAHEIIIDDSTPFDATEPAAGFSKGRNPGFCASPYEAALAFPSELMIPESEWEPRIKEREERKARLSDLCDQAGLPCKDQNGTNYCWINAPVHCLEIMRVVQNQSMVILSPASAGAIIKNFRNVGGWGDEGLQHLEEHGCVPIDKWPANAIKKQYDTDDNRQLAKKYRAIEWMRLKPRSQAEMVSCLLHNFPVACGFNWWGHETTAIEPVIVGGEVCIRHRNSWAMSYGDRGYFVLKGNKKLADDAVAARSVTAS